MVRQSSSKPLAKCNIRRLFAWLVCALFALAIGACGGRSDEDAIGGANFGDSGRDTGRTDALGDSTGSDSVDASVDVPVDASIDVNLRDSSVDARLDARIYAAADVRPDV